MKSSQELRTSLTAIHRKSYPAYKSLQGVYNFGSYTLSIDHVQGDPFASPSSLSARIPQAKAGFPREYYQNTPCRIALQDYLLRQFGRQLSQYSFKAKGSGKSGLIHVSVCGPEILERTACEVSEKELTVRFHVGFPANGRTINANELEKILFDYLPKCIEKVFYYQHLNAAALQKVIHLSEDQQAIRYALKERNLTAFVADGSVLPRLSGVSSQPLKDCVPFSSPETLRITLELPHKGTVTGMGIPKGITLIVGGGYHGKSTLLSALEAGVYNHIAGDGREYVITDDTALKLRAEDGRCIKDVDISLFINDLPNKKDTHCFSTPDASGSTSQAANIIEGIEAGSRVFLIDEDTSATNFMVRDDFMQEIIRRDQEPITPFLERAKDLYEKAGCSTILVAGSSGAFFHIADTVIQMDCYHPVDITKKVKAACRMHPLPSPDTSPFILPKWNRTFQSSRIGRPGEERMKVKVHDKDSFLLGREAVDLRYVEQLVDREQTTALAYLLRYAKEHLADGRKTYQETAAWLWKTIEKQGLGFFGGASYVPSGLAMPRPLEIFSCLNRYRG